MKYSTARSIMGAMPPLRHSIPGLAFDWDNSEVVAWLAAQPAVRRYLFGVARESKAIKFDQASGKWQGADWKP